jgi:hypothetical protein
MSGLQSAALAGVLLALVAFSGCSAPYDPSPPPDAVLRTVVLASPMDLESTYRRLFRRLDGCLPAGSGYHVYPRFDREAGRAWLVVVQGLRLERFAALVSRFAARFDVYADPPGARLEIVQRDEELGALVDAAEGWLRSQHERCAP